MQDFISSFEFQEHRYFYYDLKKLYLENPVLKKLPVSLKVLLESNLRNNDYLNLKELISIFSLRNSFKQIKFFPSRVIMNDSYGTQALLDFLSLNNVSETKIEPSLLFDLVFDNSLDLMSFRNNNHLDIKKQKTIEKYKLAKNIQEKFSNVSITPPSIASTSQVNIEYLSTIISSKEENKKIFLFPETLIGTDSHTTICNALGVFSYKSTFSKSQRAMFESFINIDFPEVLGVEILGNLAQGLSILDAIFNFSLLLKEKKVEGKILEFCGESLKNLSIEDRVSFTLMAKEAGALACYFILDENTLSYIEQTRGVDASIIKKYYELQGLFLDNTTIEYDEKYVLNLSNIKALIAGPKNINEKIFLEEVPEKLTSFKVGNFIKDNDIVLANIGSSYNINPSLLIQAALLAKKALSYGLKINENIKKSFSYVSLVQKEYLEQLGLLQYLEQIGFNIISLACDTSSKNKLFQKIELDIEKFNLNVSSVWASNVCFDESIYPLIKSSWLMSPALVIAYCFKGNMDFDISKDEISQNVYLCDIWPSMGEVKEHLEKIDYDIFKSLYKDINRGNDLWNDNLTLEENFEDSVYIKKQEIKKDDRKEKIFIKDSRILALLGNNVSCEHISPLGQIPLYTPASFYLNNLGIKPDEFFTYKFRKENTELIKRSILSNINLKNKMVHPKEGGFTKDFLSGEILSIFEFSEKMQDLKENMVLFAGENFARDEINTYTARGLSLLGVKAIIAKSFNKKIINELSFEGVLPLVFIDDDIESLHLKGNELITIKSITLKINDKIELFIKNNEEERTIIVQSLIETQEELEDYKYGGYFSYLLNK